MARLPQPGGDAEQWGDVLNDYLRQQHAEDGSHDVAKILAPPQLSGMVLASQSQSPKGVAWQQLTKQSVGLGLADNTSDIDKPISSATQVAIDQLAINVYSYGAVGNGMTDDTAAIQAAIDAASNGGTVLLPPGTYIIDPAVSLHLKTGVTIAGTGAGSILKVKSNSNVLNNIVKVEDADKVTLRDFTINGNRANQALSDAVAVHYGVYVAASNDCRVENIIVHHTTGVGVHVYNSTGTIVTGCDSSHNRYHGFECEQDTSTVWQGNRSHHNDRHGIFVSPGEVGGTGSVGNVIDSNSFDMNGSYGIAFGIDAQGISVGLTKDNVVTNNSVLRNAEYGVSIYRVDDTLVAGNVVAYNGFFGIYLYQAERNQIVGNRLRNNSQDANGAYDEILLEGANDGRASRHNMITDNFIYIDGSDKASWAVREATTSDGPNIITGNMIPAAGLAGRVNILHVSTRYDLISDTPKDNAMSLRAFDRGLMISANASLPGGTMGLDAPFGTAALRFFNDNSGGNLQFVAPNGNADWYIGGNNMLSVTPDAINVRGKFRLEVVTPPATSSSSGERGEMAWDADHLYICVATNTWHRTPHASW